MRSKFLLLVSALLFPLLSAAQDNQEDDDVTNPRLGEGVVVIDTLASPAIDPLSPSRAAFYSAILPGLGQAYNCLLYTSPSPRDA